MSSDYRNVKSGLVLEGGAMRGIYTAGVLDVLGEHGVSFDGVIGVSAGAIHGSSFVAGQHGRSIRLYLAYLRNWRFFSFRTLFLTGNFVGTRLAYGQIPDRLVPFDHKHFESSPTRFFVTCTDLATGAAFYREIGSLRGHDINALRASASLPLVSKEVKVVGRKLLDGGTSDSVPFEFFRSQGFTKTVIVLTQVKGYVKKATTNPIAKLRYRAYPAYLEAIATRPARYNEMLQKIEALEARGEVVVIRPSKKIAISQFERNTETLLSMYELGRSDALAKLKEIQAFLAS